MNKYLSRYTGTHTFISAAQYLAEFMCERRASSLNKELPIKFWRLEEWKNYFGYQVRIANQLLIKYDPACIIQVVKQYKNCYSLKSAFLIKAIQKEQETFNKKQILPSNPIVVDTKPEHQNETRKVFRTQSIIDKLRDLDGRENT